MSSTPRSEPSRHPDEPAPTADGGPPPGTPDFERTGEWLSVTPPPGIPAGPPPAAGRDEDAAPYDPPPLFPTPAAGPDDVVAVSADDPTPPPPSGVFDDDAVFLMDDAADAGPPPARPTDDEQASAADMLFGHLEKVPLAEVTAESSGFLPLPPSAAIQNIHRQMAADGDEAIDLTGYVAGGPGNMPSSVIVPVPEGAPVTPASGWLDRPAAAPPADDRADIDLPPAGGEEASDIFTHARKDPGSDVLGTGGGSALFTGASGIGSELFPEPADDLAPAGESHLLGSLGLDNDDRGSSFHDDPAMATEPLAHPDGGPASAGDVHGPDFDLPADVSGSNLLTPGTVMEFELGDDRPEPSSIDLTAPEGGPLSDAGPLSSIFSGSLQDSGPDLGRVDIDQIPVMGSTDDPTDTLPRLDTTGPSSSVSVFDPTDAEPGSSVVGDSGMIEWGDLSAAEQASLQQSLRSPTESAGLDDLADDDSSPGMLAADSEVPVGAAPSSGLESGSIFGPPSGRGRPLPRLPGSDLNLSNRAGPLAEPPAAAPARGRGLLAGAAGLLAGAALGGGAMYFVGGGGTPAGPGTPGQPSAVARAAAQPGAGGLASAETLLAGGNVEEALAAFKDAGDSDEAKAGRGQARWMVAVRKAAAENKKLTPADPDLTAAAADLQAVVAAAAASAAPADQKRGARAALNLGLIREVAGKPDDAVAVYDDAARKFPAFKAWFDSARQRVQVMKKNADGTVPAEFSRLPADDADRLATVSLVLLDFPAVQQVPEDEPGFHFWRAINYAANWQAKDAFPNAVKAINEAKAKHDARRRQLVGMGLNPVSDPREQMFLRACDELRFYWQFKGQIYADPVGMRMAREERKGTAAILTDLFKAKKEYEAAAPKLRDAEAAVAAAKKAGEELEAVKAKAAADLAAAQKEAEAQTATARQAAADNAKAATKAQADLTDANKRLAAAEAALDPVIAKLKAAKLIPEGATRAQAVAALPEAARKAALVSGGTGEAAELAKQLADAQRRVADAEGKLKAARDAEEAARADLERKVKEATAAADRRAADLAAEAKAAGERAAAAARAEMASKLEEASLARQQAEAKLAAQAERFRSELAAARAGATGPVTDVDRAAADRAADEYTAGVSLFFGGRYADAERRLAAAAAADPADARTWYFLGLSKWAVGRTQEAAADFRKGADLEARARPGRAEVGAALERVQGPARRAVDAYRP